MVSGSCLCGDFKIEYTGAPAMKAACYCLPCRKSAGTPRSFNVIVPNDHFKKLSGTAKQWVRKGDSGKNVTYNNCANCCTLMYVEAEALDGLKIVKLGVLDDDAAINDSHWDAELYTKRKVPWTTPIAGAEPKETA